MVLCPENYWWAKSFFSLAIILTLMRLAIWLEIYIIE